MLYECVVHSPGSGMKEALNILEPMINDPVNYVRQGALLSSGNTLKVF